MKKWLLPAAAAAMTLMGGAAMAHPHGYYGGSYYDRPAYGYGWESRGGHYRRGYRDSDRDGVPDRVEWGRDRDRDGRPDQWDRYDNRRRHHRHDSYSRRYEREPYYGYGYGYRY
ncbi:hypothetical protein LJR225_001191 [Phenylobacterium sp. LjRoot225]|uniref:hypothetical protein n=1 Tax=Phenylobacterium sp. LjRoot225 TaxID=3342285 RepID=UPI003ECE8018